MRPATRIRRLSLPILLGGVALAALEMGRRAFRLTNLLRPERNPLISWDPQDYGIPRERWEEIRFKSDDGELLYGWYCRARKPIASTLFCHGNTGNLTNTAAIIPHLLDGGINVFMFDYRGYGLSSGRPSLRGIVIDAHTAARFHDKIRPKHLPSILYGYSLGGAVAAQIIRQHHFDGLILQSTFTTLPAVTRVAFPRVPVHLISGRLFDTLRAVKRLDVPLLILHGGDDEVCPCWMAHALYDACPASTKRIYVVEGGLHKDLYVRDPDTLVWAVNRFATELPQETRVLNGNPSAFERFLENLRRHFRRAEAHEAL
jgi:fermentation-respiration switch protein FrsA (DUF1100 family)